MLLESLDGGRNPDIPAIGAQEALPSDDGDEEESIESEDSESLAGSSSEIGNPKALSTTGTGYRRSKRRTLENPAWPLSRQIRVAWTSST